MVGAIIGSKAVTPMTVQYRFRLNCNRGVRDLAPLPQLAEGGGLNPLQSRFESVEGHRLFEDNRNVWCAGNPNIVDNVLKTYIAACNEVCCSYNQRKLLENRARVVKLADTAVSKTAA